MQMSELVSYAKEKYNINEQHKWADFPGFSVLCHPETDKWIALLMRGWNEETGEMAERCDLKCGRDAYRASESYLGKPIRMRGSNWISITFNDDTKAEVIFSLFDKAIKLGSPQGHLMVLSSLVENESYKDTKLPFQNSSFRKEQSQHPQKLRELRKMFYFGPEARHSRDEIFYRQAVFMADFQDDYPWFDDFICYFPTYQDLTTRQLRGYFSWRTQIRKGNYRSISASAVYIYIYELLNGITCSSDEEVLEKLKEFKEKYVDSGLGDARMRMNLEHWMLEYAVINNVEAETARKYIDPGLLEKDHAIQVLKNCEQYSDNEIFEALNVIDKKKLINSAVIKADPARGKHLFADAWKLGCKEMDLFKVCFGNLVTSRWFPLHNAIYHHKAAVKDREYILDECRKYQCINGTWWEETYENIMFNRLKFGEFLHEAEVMFRRYLKSGHYLKEKEEEKWAEGIINTVIENDKKALIEARKPKITIELSNLEKVRQDAMETRDSLLVEEELPEDEYINENNETETEEETDSRLDPLQTEVIKALLTGSDVTTLIRSRHLMSSIVADEINEALFDEIGDTVIICEDDRLFLVDDYISDMEKMIGGYLNERE